jgi:hypothetical protein
MVVWALARRLRGGVVSVTRYKIDAHSRLSELKERGG